MPEYMLLVRNEYDHQQAWTDDQHHEFLKKCEVYINRLNANGQIIIAQPLIREGKIISGSKGEWKEAPFNQNKEVQVGYYHIRAKNMDEAIEIAKGNPEFEYGTKARIEVRPIKTKEETTGYTYPA